MRLSTIFCRVALVAVVAMFGFAATSCSRLQPSVEDVLQLTVDQVNALTPIEVDEITRLDSASYGEPAQLRYHYTLSLDSLSATERDDMVAYMRKAIPDRIRAEEGTAELNAMGVTFVYLYVNPSGEPLFDIAFEPAEYAPIDSTAVE